jgi:hypothetical protein
VKSLAETLEKIKSDLEDSEEKYENDEDESCLGDSGSSKFTKNKKFDLSDYYKTFLRHKRGR